MDILSLAVAALSLLVVVVMAVIVARLLRDERRRSDARVAALMAMAAQVEHGAASQPIPDLAGGDDLRPLPSQGPVDAAAHMFAQPQRSTPWGRRLAIITPLALILTGVAVAYYPSEPDIAGPGHSASGRGEQPAAALPLELLSLHHTQQGDTLTVTGLVQNPRTASPLSKVVVTAFVFAGDGTFLASGRAPLDFTTLAPGDESPFVVSVPVKGQVARYRIGFRGEDGRVIAHVDRRASPAIARANEERP